MKPLSIADHEIDGSIRRCPVCSGSINRIPRRLIDLAFSLIMPVQRYRCRALNCDWEGNLRVK